MAKNNFGDYVKEILRHVIAHTNQKLEHGCCNCNSGVDNPNNNQTVCLPAERLASVMRGEAQNYSVNSGIGPYQFRWED